MSDALTLSDLKAGGVRLEAAIKKSLSVEVRTLEIQTNDEWLTSTYFIELEKDSSSSIPEALAMLSSAQLHWLEEWNRSETQEDEVRHIARTWLVPTFNRLLFLPVDKQEAEETLQEHFEHLSQVGASGRDIRIGIIADGAPKGLEWMRAFPTEPILSGLVLEKRWNSIEMFYETQTRFGLFSWSTGA